METPIQLATAARVSCRLLEEEIAIPVHVVQTEPVTVTLPDPPVQTPARRPTGFDRVRRKMQRRANPCALVELPEDRPKLTRAGQPRAKKRPASDNREGAMRGVADHGYEIPTWRAVERAWLEKKFDPAETYTHVQIRQILGRYPGSMDHLCLTLAEHRSLVKMIHVEACHWRFAARFAGPV